MSDEELNFIASTVFSDEHYGRALTNDEVLRREFLEEDYKDEISMAKLMLANNPDFVSLPFEKKIEISSKLICELREKRELNEGKSK